MLRNIKATLLEEFIVERVKLRRESGNIWKTMVEKIKKTEWKDYNMSKKYKFESKSQLQTNY